MIFFLTVFYFFFFRIKRRFLIWVEDHWFYKTSFTHKLSNIFYVIGLSLLTFALLDLRGPEKKVQGETQDQKTIILVDSSASMLAEDVRPNRFKKALLLVKHFVKKAVGQQISLVVFSDNQKRIVPFTKDIDLINARIDRLESLNLRRGGTGLSQAIQESIEYFRTSTGDLNGNILVFTDAEETELSLKLKIPEGITIAMIGVGTSKGAPIPLRNSRGQFSGNKKFKGRVVISKLNESLLSGLKNDIKHYKYWIATSYSLPTEEILSFFNRVEGVKKTKGEYLIKPVLANYLLVPGVISLMLAFLMNFRKTFVMSFMLFISGYGFSNENIEETEPVRSEETLMLEGLFSEGKLENKGKLKLAENLLTEGFKEESMRLYEEILPDKMNKKNLKDFSNFAIGKLSNGDQKGGVALLRDILKEIDRYNDPTFDNLQKAVEKNLLNAIKENESDKKKKDQEEGQKDKKKNKDDSGEGEDSKDKKGSGGEPGEDEKDSKTSDKGQNGNKDQDSASDEDKKKKNEQEGKGDKGDKKEEEKKKGGDKKSELSEAQGKGEKGKKKLPAILKQLINDDNQLQKKVIDAKTVERKSREEKDW